MFWGEESCFYVNESGVVESQVRKIHKLSLDFQQQKFSAPADDWWKSPMFSLLIPFVGPLVYFVTMEPFILGRITHFIQQQFDSLASKSIQAYYHRLDLADHGLDEPSVSGPPVGAT